MAIFTTFARRKSPTTQDLDLPDEVRRDLPLHFAAVAEALVSNGDLNAACSVVGRDVARDGAALGEALSGLRATFALVSERRPTFEAAEALSIAWSEATLQYLHELSCEDPLTGLASLAHVRTRLDEIYRDAELTDISAQTSHALVIVELVFLRRSHGPDHAFTRALRLVQITEAVRAVYSGGQTIGRLGLERAVAVVPRDADLGTTVALLREFLDDLDLGPAETRVWIEGLPRSADSSGRLLDELAR
jgi:GGDEF domain-containing protein